MRTKNITFTNQEICDKISKIVKTNQHFKPHCTVIETAKTYPHHPLDMHIDLVVQGRDKDLHAIEAMAILSWQVESWK